MLKAIVSLLFVLLAMTVAGEDNYAPTQTVASEPHTASYSYRQTENPCKKAIDFILINRFAEILHVFFTTDNSDQTSKSKSVLRLLSALCEYRKQELQTNHINYHLHSSLYPYAVDYYVYTLRRIII